jgi:hypothetical protein
VQYGSDARGKQGTHGDEGVEERVHRRHEDHVLAQPLERLARLAAHADDAAAARLHLLYVRHDLLEYLGVFLRDDDDGREEAAHRL